MSDVKFSLANIKKRMEKIQEFSRHQAEAGVLNNTHRNNKDGTVSKLGSAELAAIHSTGTIASGRYIPPRDYRGIAFNANKKKYAKLIGKEVAKDNPSPDVFKVVGQIAMADQKKSINDMTPANAISTIKAKGKNTPLIDTGTLYKSITFRIIKVKKLWIFSELHHRQYKACIKTGRLLCLTGTVRQRIPPGI